MGVGGAIVVRELTNFLGLVCFQKRRETPLQLLSLFDVVLSMSESTTDFVSKEKAAAERFCGIINN